MALELFDDFEDNDLSEWTVYNLNTHNQPYSGSYSAGLKTGTTTLSEYTLAKRSFSEPVKTVELYYRESNNSHGGGYELVDNNGNQVCAAGTSNPGWDIMDGSTGERPYSGDGYKRWVRLRFDIDYGAGQVTYTFEDQNSGTQKSYTRSLRTNNKVTEIRIVNIDSYTSFESRSNDGSNCEHLTDYIRADYLEPPSAPSPSLSVVANDRLDVSVSPPSDWGSEVGNYRVEILRDGSSWRNPSGGPSTPSGSTSTQTYTYGPNSDTAYGRQVGIDSSFRFRVRAENSAGNSGWVTTDLVFTDPVPPHDPSGSRPDGTTLEINWSNR